MRLSASDRTDLSVDRPDGGATVERNALTAPTNGRPMAILPQKLKVTDTTRAEPRGAPEICLRRKMAEAIDK